MVYFMTVLKDGIVHSTQPRLKAIPWTTGYWNYKM